MSWSSSPSEAEVEEFADSVRKIQRHHTEPMDELFSSIQSPGFQPSDRQADADQQSFSFSFKPAGFSGYVGHSDNPTPGGFGRTILITGSGDYDGIAVFIQDFIQVVVGDEPGQRVTEKAKILARALLKLDDFSSIEKIQRIRAQTQQKPPTTMQTISLKERDLLMAKPILPAIIALRYGAYKFFDLGTDSAHWPYTYAVCLGAVGSIAGVALFSIEASKPTRRSWVGAFSGLAAFLPYLFALYLMGFLGCYQVYSSFGPFSVWGLLGGLFSIAVGYRMLFTTWVITEKALH